MSSKRSRRRRGHEKDLPEKVDQYIPESRLLTALQGLEKKVDRELARKHQRIKEALGMQKTYYGALHHRGWEVGEVQVQVADVADTVADEVAVRWQASDEVLGAGEVLIWVMPTTLIVPSALTRAIYAFLSLTLPRKNVIHVCWQMTRTLKVCVSHDYRNQSHRHSDDKNVQKNRIEGRRERERTNERGEERERERMRGERHERGRRE
eukprot:494734-Amorphochlora_amoeboformis.AAC.1